MGNSPSTIGTRLWNNGSLAPSFLANALPEQNIPENRPAEREDLVRLACRGRHELSRDQGSPDPESCPRDSYSGAAATRGKTCPGAARVAGRKPGQNHLLAQDSPPFLSARIQDLYGVSEDLKIACGRVALVIHVLAPNHRPVQVTNSLKTFWAESYPKLKQTLQRQYPKHEWR